MIICVLSAVWIFWSYIVLWIQVMSGVGVKSNQTIPFFEALAVLDQLQTNQEINDIVMLDDQDFKKNM